MDNEKTTAFNNRLVELPVGHFTGKYRGKKYGVTLRRPAPGIIKLFAEELGGSDIVSFNHYFLSSNGWQLKPCEMNSAKVIDFVLQAEFDF